MPTKNFDVRLDAIRWAADCSAFHGFVMREQSARRGKSVVETIMHNIAICIRSGFDQHSAARY